MEINRVWSMPNKHTFDIKPIKEIIDVDAVTGGYNLQVAWSTGYLAGISVC